MNLKKSQIVNIEKQPDNNSRCSGDRQEDNMAQDKPDMQEMMQVYQKYAAPGDQHRMLAKLAGNWTTRTKGWMDPQTPPMESEGTCRQSVLLDGRYLQQVYESDMMGTPFTGINLLAYDNFTGKYMSTWIDSMSTGIYFFEGEADADGRRVTQLCRYEDPVKGPCHWRSVTRFVDDDTIEYEMFITPEGGKEDKMMEMTLKRKS